MRSKLVSMRGIWSKVCLPYRDIHSYYGMTVSFANYYGCETLPLRSKLCQSQMQNIHVCKVENNTRNNADNLQEKLISKYHTN